MANIGPWLGYASAAIAVAYVAWNVGVGVKDWASGRGVYYDVANNSEITEKEIVAKYGKEGAKVFTNGITQDFQNAIDLAKKQGADILFYNPTHGAIADLTECTLGYATGTESLSRQLGRLTISMRVELIGYSQGSIISANALIYSGLHGGAVAGSKISIFGSAVGGIREWFSSAVSGAINGGSYVHHFDPIRLTSSEINPVGYLEGFLGLISGGSQHAKY